MKLVITTTPLLLLAALFPSTSVAAASNLRQRKLQETTTTTAEARDFLDIAPIISPGALEEVQNLVVLQEEQDAAFVTLEIKEESDIIAEEDEALEVTFVDLNPEFEEILPQPDTLVYERKLMDHHDMHMPLMCNMGVNWETMACSSFSALLTQFTGGQTVVVPCGQCYEVDITDGSEVDLPSGLHIEGKLYFPPAANVIVKTTHVFVLGLLKMDTPSVSNLVKFHLYGEDHQVFTAGDMSHACGMGCDMGSKVIAVHGGQLDIKGIEDECPSWEKLTNVGAGVVRPFIDHLPIENSASWTTDIIELTGSCHFSQGHTDDTGKNVVWCPIKNTGAHIGGGTNLPIKLTSVGVEPFAMPSDDSQTLSLTIRSDCGRAGHTDSFGRCVLYCPVESTANIGSGHGSSLTFTNRAPVPANHYEMPTDSNGNSPTLKIKSACVNSEGHSSAWGRCVLRCPLHSTVNYGSGSGWKDLEMTSVYHPPPSFPMPVSGSTGEEGSFVLGSACVFQQGHTDAWGGCVVRCPLEPTYSDLGAYHSAAWLVNPASGEKVVTSRFIQWAHGGSNMYILLDPAFVSKAECATQGADALNNVFNVGDTMEPTYRIVDDPSKDGSKFSIDGVMHFAHGGSNLYFWPSAKDPTPAACNAVRDEFNTGFPAGYEITLDYPQGPQEGQTFNVNGVHHWAWGGSTMYFFPENEDVASCGTTTLGDFRAKFPIGYSIDVTSPLTKPLNQVTTASGVHHWSWSSNSMYLYADETADDINAKFEAGYQLQVSFGDSVMDTYEVEVSPEALSCWKPGTEVLLTSHTRSMHDQQVRTIETTNPTTGLIKFTSPIEIPITKADDVDFAIEIASLNRRIVFEADDDTNDNMIGGHLVVHHTTSKQTIEGVEIKNFGQAGRLGKYPLHFHMCGDSPESLVKKNVVRNSNQRCYVIHLTNNVSLEENVAFDNFGHCYFIEDGAETGNVFRKNLGSGVKNMPQERVDSLSAASGRTETDRSPHGFNGASVFWISNPQNFFYGNVAAGGEKNGYWFETHGDRMYMPIAAFEDNEVHSAGAMAFTVYQPGWRPNQVSLIKNLKVYRNPSWGAFLHVTRNLHFEGGVFADNGDRAIMVNRGDDLVFDGTKFIGKTSFTAPHCNSWSEKVGISMNNHRLAETVRGSTDGSIKGLIAKNLEFSNWSPEATQCSPSGGSMAIKFNYEQSFIKAMNAYHYFENLHFDDTSVELIDACMSGSNIDDVSIEIGSDSASSALGGSPGFLVSPKVSPMVGGCVSYNDCLDFCAGACLRTISVLAGDAAFGEKMVMIVSDGNNEITIHRDVHGHPLPQPIGNTVSSVYTTVLPKNSYTVRFESIDSPGTIAWPKYVAAVFEASPSCADHIVRADLEFVTPLNIATRTECDDLIFNGGFDGVDTEWGIEGWNGFYSSVSWTDTGGVSGSGALRTVNTLAGNSLPTQVIDSSCLVEGAQYDITVDYKVVDADMNPIAEDPNAVAPYVRAKLDSFDTATSKWSNGGWPTLASTIVSHPTAAGWQRITGLWTVTAAQATADQLRVHVAGGNYHLLIDNFSIATVQQ